MDLNPEDNTIALQRKAKLAARASVVFFFLLAFSWPIGAFFFWIFGGAAVYCGFLAVYFLIGSRPSQNDEASPEVPNPSFSGFSKPNVNLSKILQVRTLILAAVGIVFVGIVARSILSNSEPENTQQNTSQEITTGEESKDVEAMITSGNDFYNKGNYDEALKYYEMVLVQDPGNQFGLYNKALVYYARKDFNRSLPILKNCVELHSDYGEAYWLIGDIYVNRNMADSAKFYMARAYLSGLRNGSFLQLMASLYENENKTRAIQLYQESVKQDSTLLESYQKLVLLDPSHAQEYMLRIKQLGENNTK